MTAGYYCRPRGWRADPLFAAEPYSEREAWDWLCERAAFVPHVQERHGHGRALDVGELLVTERELARTWGWHRSRVRRFLHKLQAAKYLTIQAVKRADKGPDKGPNKVASKLTLCEQRQIELLRTRVRTTLRTGVRTTEKEKGIPESGNPEARARVEVQDGDGGGADATPGGDGAAALPEPAPEPAPEPSKVVPLRPGTPAKTYAFAGRVIRLTEADYAAWRDRLAPDVPDLRAWLWERDQRLARLPAGDRRRREWFCHVSATLVHLQQEWAAKRRAAAAEAPRPRRLPPVFGSREAYLARGEIPPPEAPSSDDLRAGRAEPYYGPPAGFGGAADGATRAATVRGGAG